MPGLTDVLFQASSLYGGFLVLAPVKVIASGLLQWGLLAQSCSCGGRCLRPAPIEKADTQACPTDVPGLGLFPWKSLTHTQSCSGL